MPNWCYNTLRIKGPSAMLYKFQMDMIAVCGEGEYRHFSYSFCTPMPEEYVKTTSPTPQSEKEIREMAAAYNWEPGVLERKLEYAMTDEQRAFYDSLIEKYGFENWYDWANANWGTKWDACDSGMFPPVRTPRTLTYKFNSPWGTPYVFATRLITKMKKDYPGLTFEWTYTLEGEYGKHTLFTHQDFKDAVVV